MSFLTAASDRSSSGGVSLASATPFCGGACITSVLTAISISWTPALEVGQFQRAPTLCEECRSIFFCSDRDVQALSRKSGLPPLCHRACSPYPRFLRRVQTERTGTETLRVEWFHCGEAPQ